MVFCLSFGRNQDGGGGDMAPLGCVCLAAENLGFWLRTSPFPCGSPGTAVLNEVFNLQRVFWEVLCCRDEFLI